MIKIKKPELDSKEILEACLKGMNNSETKTNLLSSKNEIINSSEKYDEIGEKGELYKIPQMNGLKSGATKEDMAKLYKNRFVSGPGRKYYDAIMSLAPYGRCPYCGHRNVSTLDHYMAKSKYPLYAVTQYNLIPSCQDCNKSKLDEVIIEKCKEPINPYYDGSFCEENWISAKLIENEDIAFDFYVDAPKDWTDEQVLKAKNHFKMFNLNKLYQLQSSEEFISTLNNIRRVYKRAGKAAAIESIEEQIEDVEIVRLNTWKAAMYRAILRSNWFWETFLVKNIDL